MLQLSRFHMRCRLEAPVTSVQLQHDAVACAAGGKVVLLKRDGSVVGGLSCLPSGLLKILLS